MLRCLQKLNDFSHRLTQPMAIEDGRPPKILTATLFIVSTFTVSALLWAVLTNVRELTIAPGQIIPRGQVLSVQHLEGGIVAEILVREGSAVVEAQPLVRLQPAGTLADRNQLESRQASLKLQLIRLDALSKGETPSFENAGRGFAQLVEEQVNLHHSGVVQRRNERATLAARVAQKRSERAMIAADLETAKLQLGVQKEQYAIQTRLADQGYTSRRAFLESKSIFQRVQGEVVNLEGKLNTATEAVIEGENALLESDANAQRKIAEEKAKAAADLAETQQSLAKFSDRADRLLIRAPTAGFVQELGPKSQGEVIRPGDMVARIVPLGQELVAEIRIPANDIGHVKVGASATVKVMTYDSALFGTLDGRVEYLSATTFLPQPGVAMLPGQMAGEPFYKAIIHLPRNYVGTGALMHSIAPGMILQAQIVTGSKSIARYMLKPVFNSVDVAFSER